MRGGVQLKRAFAARSGILPPDNKKLKTAVEAADEPLWEKAERSIEVAEPKSKILLGSGCTRGAGIFDGNINFKVIEILKRDTLKYGPELMFIKVGIDT
jgi:hypothetical protein